MAGRCVQKFQGEVDGRFSYHGRRIGSVAFRWRSDAWQGRFDDSVATTREGLGDELQGPSPCGAVVSDLTGVSNDEGKGTLEISC